MFYLCKKKPTDQETASIKKDSVSLIIPKRKVPATSLRATWRSTRVGQETGGRTKSVGHKTVLWLLLEGMGKAR